MPIDRDATLKSAEKLLRQGKLEAAIAEYVRLTADQPRDWSSVNALGDLYVRAGEPERALAQFARVADHLVREGSVAKAAAVYRKMLRLSPSDPRAARGLAAIGTKGGRPSAASARVPSDVPADPEAKIKAARLAQDAEDIQRGCELLVEAADFYESAGRPADALAAIAEAADADPSNLVLRERMLRMLIAQGEILQARYVARMGSELLLVAEAYERLGRQGDALDVAIEATRVDHDNRGLRERVLRELLDGGDVERARGAARTSADLLLIAGALGREGRNEQVLDLIGEAVRREPNDADLRRQFVTACLGIGEVNRARQAARTTPELQAVADALDTRGDAVGARQVRAEALRREPDDAALRARLIDDYLRAGELEQVRWLLTLKTAGTDPALLRLLARLEFAAGRPDEARRALSRLLSTPRGRQELLRLGCELADEDQAEPAYVCISLCTEFAVSVGDWKAAAAALQEFTTRVTHHIPALTRFVEICVDGGMDATMPHVQGLLADALIAAGKGPEARLVAEDLVLRAPWDPIHVERCRRALALAGDLTPDRTIAELLSADGPTRFEDL